MDDADIRFRFKLAAHLGIVNPFMIDYLLTEREFGAWVDYFNTEPFLADRIENQLATLIAVVFNMFAKEPVSQEDFMVSKIRKKSKAELFDESFRRAFNPKQV